MNCRTVRLSGGSATDPLTAQAIAAHLAECPACMDELGTLPASLISPASAIPPPTLTARIMAQLPATPAIAAQIERRTAVRRWIWRGLALTLLAVMVGFGLVGMLVDSNVPATVFGGTASTTGRAAMALTLAGKPMIAVLTSVAVPLVALIGLICWGALWAWRRLARPIPALVLVEAQEGR